MRIALLTRRKGEQRWRTPTVTAYTAEAELETMLRGSPELLPGEDDLRPIAMADQLSVSVGSVDLVGVSATGSLTVVECKLRANPEIRRNVIGQLFAYGSALWGMSYEAFDERWRHRTGTGLADQVAAAAEEQGLDFERESFVAAVADNLEGGRFTLLVAVDEITEELQRVIEYLSAHTAADVRVAALELGYVAEGDLEILVPQVFGLELAVKKPGSPGGPHVWTQEEVFAALADDPMATRVARALKAWAAQQRLLVDPVTTVSPGLVWHLEALGSDYRFFTLDTGFRQLNIQSNSLKRKPIIEDPSRRATLIAALNEVYPIPPERADKVPAIPLAALADEGAFEAFTAAWEAIIDDIRNAEAAGR